ncbi:hypothetical protein [Streptomyces sp. NPDC101234]|uniref:hypothetical protein n=1 Tax=Streptomyces sp. NPDC101234 TaxID=3366138 RepID=UPI003812375E
MTTGVHDQGGSPVPPATRDADTGLGVIRQADAGYPTAVTTRESFGLGLPS